MEVGLRAVLSVGEGRSCFWGAVKLRVQTVREMEMWNMNRRQRRGCGGGVRAVDTADTRLV